ncbi:MAG: transposase [Chloroflexi bacterium]|nr:transposase [Chloroflexota bacterium]
MRRALERLAATNGCGLQQVSVQPEPIHLVVTCPPGRDSAWAAYLFKNGSEEIIQQEFNVTANLWETGYYATESEEPLTETELNLFLERDV